MVIAVSVLVRKVNKMNYEDRSNSYYELLKSAEGTADVVAPPVSNTTELNVSRDKGGYLARHFNTYEETQRDLKKQLDSGFTNNTSPDKDVATVLSRLNKLVGR